MIDISPIQILIVLVIALLVFGPRRLPEMGRNIGRGLRELKSSINDFSFDEPATPPRRPDSRAQVAEEAAPPAEEAVSEPPDAADPDDDLDGIVVPGDAPPR